MADLKAELAPRGVLRAGLNMSNFLLVTAGKAGAAPTGIVPDLAADIAARLGVGIEWVPYKDAGLLSAGSAGDAAKDEWDVAFMGAEPARAKVISFTPAYVEIEATYLVPPGSPIRSIADVDKPGVRIVVNKGAAYDLWLERNIKQASIVHPQPKDKVFSTFMSEKMEAYAGLRPALLEDVQKYAGSRILDGNFTTVQQAVGTAKTNVASAKFLADFVEEAKRTGLVAKFIEQHGVKGLSVAPPA